MRRFIRSFLSFFLVLLMLLPANLWQGLSAHSNLQPRSFIQEEEIVLAIIMLAQTGKLSLSASSLLQTRFPNTGTRGLTVIRGSDSLSETLQGNVRGGVYMDEQLKRIERQGHAQPGDSEAQFQLVREALRGGEIAQAIEAYHTYLIAMRTSSLEEIEIFPMTLNRIYETISHELKQNNLTLSHLHFLFGAFFLQLKAYKESGWPQEGPLTKQKIYNHIFGSLLGGWESNSLFGEDRSARENSVRSLSTAILFQMRGVKKITGFGEAEQEMFGESSEYDPDQPYLVVPANILVWTKNYVDLRGANLMVADLHEANLFGAYLSNANLIGANLIRANLEEASLDGADLRGANLSGANLMVANLPNANLDGADLILANLTAADLTEANLNRANLINANLEEANLSRANLSFVNLSGASLSAADLRGANLRGSYLSEATLKGAIIFRSQLSQYSDLFTEEQIASMVFAEDVILPSAALEASL